MKSEVEIQKEIMIGISDICIIERANAGSFWQGKLLKIPIYGNILSNLRAVKGVKKGHTDLFGTRRSDGKSVYIETKTKANKLTEDQLNFIRIMKENNAIAGVARSVKEARDLILGDNKMNYFKDCKEVINFIKKTTNNEDIKNIEPNNFIWSPFGGVLFDIRAVNTDSFDKEKHPKYKIYIKICTKYNVSEQYSFICSSDKDIVNIISNSINELIRQYKHFMV